MFYYISHEEGFENAILDPNDKKPILCMSKQCAEANAYVFGGTPFPMTEEEIALLAEKCREKVLFGDGDFDETESC